MVIAILAPELVMLWAMRQIHVARKIAKEFKEYGWTTGHGFLAIMKGIALYKGDKFCAYIEYKSGFTRDDRVIKNEIEDLLDESPNSLEDYGHSVEAASTSTTNGLQTTLEVRHADVHDRPSSQQSKSHDSPTQSEYHLATVVNQSLRVPNEACYAIPRFTGVTTHSGELHDNQASSQTPPNTTRCAKKNSNATSLAPSLVDEDRGASDSSHLPGHDSSDPRGTGSNQEDRTSDGGYSCLLHYLIVKGVVAIPKSEITGTLNHGDFLAKIVALLQTGWFLGKIAGRRAERLFITELEVIALSCTCLSFVAYVCWWDKPQRVRYPYRVFMPKRTPGQPQFEEANSFATWVMNELRALWCRVHDDHEKICPKNRHWAMTILFLPFYPTFFFARQMITLVNADGARELVPDYLFSCGTCGFSTPRRIYAALYGISVFVGLLHIWGWKSSPAPASNGPQLAWRINTILATALPILTMVTHVLILQHIKKRDTNSENPYIPLLSRPSSSDARSISESSVMTRMRVMNFIHALLLFLYIVVRWALIVLALWAMRSLPPDALLDVQWELRFLHIG
ncbi:hypothetical protein V5O48_013051 [Marasmius crinis-equi]|uniref:Uncharacterized protein n=1 Tax=Marasmius crinis-equi TaxID=585013 RepID=A0ABR3F160_9AGAR